RRGRRRRVERDPRGARARRQGPRHLRRQGGPRGTRPRHRRAPCARPGHGRKCGVSQRSALMGPALRMGGLVLALVLLVVVGVATAGERFWSTGNLITVLSLAAVTGVVSIGMTFVITSGGIDLSVGAVVGLASVWASTLSTQYAAEDFGWWVIPLTALAVGLVAGLINGLLVAYGKMPAFMATLAMLAAARGLAEIIAGRRTQIVTVEPFFDVFQSRPLGVPAIGWIFAVVAAAGRFQLNRTTFGRRTVAVGGTPEASRLAGIKIRRHTLYLYGLAGLTAGIGAVILLARTT